MRETQNTATWLTFAVRPIHWFSHSRALGLVLRREAFAVRFCAAGVSPNERAIMWVGVVVLVVSLFYLWSSWSPRITSSPDRHRRAAMASAVPARVVGLIDRHPVAAVALAVPGTLVAIASMGTYPFVVVALLVLFGAALVLMDMYNSGHSGVERRMQVTAVAAKRNHQQRAGHARSPADQAVAQAQPNPPSVVVAAPPQLDLTQHLVSGQCDPGTNLIRLRLEFEAEAKAAEALAAQAEALAAEARARGIQLRLEEASAKPGPLPG
jgi:hypothetical protein